jgi:hypothetical protein
MTFTSGDLAIIISACAVLIGAYATYRNSVRKSEFERLQARVVETERRLADAEGRATANERRALDSERRAADYRQAVVKIGEEMVRERDETARRLAIIVTDGNSKIQKVVIVLEKVMSDLEAATGVKPDIDMDALKRLVVIDSVTGQLGPIDVEAVKRAQ